MRNAAILLLLVSEHFVLLLAAYLGLAPLFPRLLRGFYCLMLCVVECSYETVESLSRFIIGMLPTDSSSSSLAVTIVRRVGERGRNVDALDDDYKIG